MSTISSLQKNLVKLANQSGILETNWIILGDNPEVFNTCECEMKNTEKLCSNIWPISTCMKTEVYYKDKNVTVGSQVYNGN